MIIGATSIGTERYDKVVGVDSCLTSGRFVLLDLVQTIQTGTDGIK